MTTCAPTALPVLVQNIPDELRQLPQWVGWRYVEDGVDPKTGEVDWDKPPVNIKTGRKASSTDPQTWVPFEQAHSAYLRGGLDGVGLVLHRSDAAEGPGLIGVDLDKCRNPSTGEIEEWALEIVRRLNTYTEVSVSGTGLRLFLHAELPPRGRKKGRYENYQTARYVTVTGQHLDGTPLTIEDRQAALEDVHHSIFGDVTATRATHKGNGDGAGALNLDDEEIVRRAGEAKNGAKFRRLWSGDVNGHKSRSEADLALCNYLAFWCGPDRDRIADLFARSGLFRSKWQRPDYRERTIGVALQGRTEYYRESRKRPRRPRENGDGKAKVTEPAQEQVKAGFHLTDQGNAERVINRHGVDLRYCHPWKRWLVWDGRRWAEDEIAEAVRRVKETRADLYRQTADAIKELGSADDDDDEERKAAAKWLTRVLRHCLAWEDARALGRCLEVAKSEPKVPILPSQLDSDPFLFNVLNGTINLRSGELRRHRREDYLTKLAPVEYDPNARCPLWDRVLDRIMDRKVQLVEYLKQLFGHCLTGDVGEQALWFFHGEGANGKSTVLGAIREMMGDYAIQAVPELLMAKSNESHPTERADLFGRRFVATIETEEGKRMAEALMKQLTGGDRIRARKMRQDFFEFPPTHKIILAANHKPVIRGTDHGAWRRIKLVPFAVKITEKEKDKTLPEKLRAEYPGILAWAVRGCLDWQRNGLTEPDEVRKATEGYQAEMDTLQEFIDACCFKHKEAKIKASILLEAYGKWSGETVTPKAFTQRLVAKGYPSERGTGGAAFYKGVGLPSGGPATGG
jgi:putative DNA primase/helicase